MKLAISEGGLPSSAGKYVRQRWRFGFATLALVLGAACMDGYPTHDVPAFDPLHMTQAQRLERMNLLGDRAHPQRRWSYALLPGCVLRIDFDGPAGPRPSFDIPLLGTAVRVATDKSDSTFAVQVRPTHVEARSGVVVLEAQEWINASVMLRILLVVKKGCTDD